MLWQNFSKDCFKFHSDNMLCWVSSSFDLSSVCIGSEDRDRLACMGVKRSLEFVRGRKALRFVLGHFFSDFFILTGPGGRLVLSGVDNVEISLSHFSSNILVGVSLNGFVGVDILKIRDVDCLRLANRILQEKEYSAWLKVGLFSRLKVLLVYWSVKESMIKCVGGNGWQMKDWRLDFYDSYCVGYNNKLEKKCFALYSVIDDSFIVSVAKHEDSILSNIGCIKF